MSSCNELETRRIGFRINIITEEEYTPIANFSGFEITRVGIFKNHVTWKGIPSASLYQWLYVQKADNLRGPWRTIKVVKPFDAPFLVDITANNTLYRPVLEYYRILVPSTKDLIGPTSPTSEVDPYGAEIAKRHYIKLSKGKSGNPCLLYSRIRTGVRCTCFNDDLQKITIASCPNCANTGYLMGYYDPIRLYVHFGPEQHGVTNSLTGPEDTGSRTQHWTSAYPQLATGDVLLDEITGYFYYVKDCQVNTYKRIVTKQTFTALRAVGDQVLFDLLERKKPAEGIEEVYFF